MKRIIIDIFLSFIAALMASGLLLIAFAYYYQDELIAGLNEQLKQHLKADVVMEDLSVNLIDQFPEITVHGQQVVVVSHETNTELLRAEEIDFTFNIFKFLEKDFQIKRIKLKGGYLHMTVEESGKKNFKIFPEKSPEEKPKEFRIFLANITFEDFGLIYDNQKTGLYCSVRAKDFTASTLALNKQLSVFAEGGLTVFYLDKKAKNLLSDRQIYIDTKVLYNFDQKTISVRKGDIVADKSTVSLTGSVDMINYKLHKLKLRSDHILCETLLSFLPDNISEPVRKFNPQGYVKFLAEANRLDDAFDKPEITAFLETDEKLSVYVDQLNKTIEDIQFKAEFTSGKKRDIETYTLLLDDFKGKLDGRPIKGQFYLQNFKEPYVKAKLQGQLEAENLTRIVKKSPISSAYGLISFDLNYQGGFKDPIKQFSTKNSLSLRFDKITLKLKSLKPIVYLVNGTISIDRNTLQVDHLTGLVGKNRLMLDTEVHNWRTFITKNSGDPTVQLELKLPSLFLGSLTDKPFKQTNLEADLKNLYLLADATFDQKAIQAGNILDNGQLEIDELRLQPKRYTHPIILDQAKLAVKGYDVILEQFEGHIANSDFHINALFNNILPSEIKKEKGVEITLDLVSNSIDLTNLVIEPLNKEKEIDPNKHKVLKNLKLNCALHVPSGDFSADSLLYLTAFYVNDLDFNLQGYEPSFKDFKGEVHIIKSDIFVEDFHAYVGHSDFNIDGALKNAFNPKERLLVEVDLKSNLLDFDEMILKRDEASNEPIDVVSIKLPDLNIKGFCKKVKYKKYTNNNFQADLSFTDNKIFDIRTLQTQIAGGRVGMEGILDVTDRSDMVYDGVVRLEDIDLTKFLKIFENFDQELLAEENVGGQATINLSTRIYIDEKLNPDLEKSEVISEAYLRNGQLVNFQPLKIMSIFFRNEDLEKVEFDDLENVIVYKDSVIYIPKMKISSNLGHFYVTGTQSIDGQMDYYVEVPIRILKIIPLKALKRIPYYLAVTLPRKILGRPPKKQTPYEEDRLIPIDAIIHIEGTPKDYEVSYETKDDIGYVTDAILDYYKEELKINIDKLLEEEKDKDRDEKKFR